MCCHRKTVHIIGLTVLLGMSNSVVVATLYLNQGLVQVIAQDLGSHTIVSIMPALTLFGYAMGVGYCSTVASDLSDPSALLRHWLLLAFSLAACALAPSSEVLVGSCFLLGAGAALTQRLLCCAAAIAPSSMRAMTIGWIIAFGLCGIVSARYCGLAVANLLGWRAVFWVQAGAACFAALMSVTVARRTHTPGYQGRLSLPSPIVIWKQQKSLRQAALQQASVFAAFNMSWAAFLIAISSDGTTHGIKLAAVALGGAATAVAAGRWCVLWRADRVANTGAVAVAVAAAALGTWYDCQIGYLGMVLLDCGTQAALVSNQARAQATATDPAMRGRFAACLTTVSFTGGALGSALGFRLLQKHPPSTVWFVASTLAVGGWLSSGGLALLNDYLRRLTVRRFGGPPIDEDLRKKTLFGRRATPVGRSIVREPS